MTENTSPEASEAPIVRALLDIHELSDPQIAALSKAVLSADAYSLDEDRLARVAGELQLSTTKLRRILILLSNLHRFLHDTADQPTSQPDSAKEGLLSAFRDIGVLPDELINPLADRLVPLLINEAADERRKVERLEKGFLPNAQSLQTIVDVRPVFSSTRTEIIEWITVAQFRVLTDKDGDDSSFVFQVSEQTLLGLREAVDLLERKMTALKTQPAKIANR